MNAGDCAMPQDDKPCGNCTLCQLREARAEIDRLKLRISSGDSPLPPEPVEVDPPGTLRTDLILLRDEMLMKEDAKNTVLLSHVIAWLAWAHTALEKKHEGVAHQAVAEGSAGRNVDG